jgi:uncharacterized membrane protein YsdA (DUF1294 family)
MLRFLTLYFFLINIVTFVTFGIDKNLSKHNQLRVPESTLLLLSALGGALGGFLAMYIFRHKTQKAKFFLVVPMLLVLHIVIAILVTFKNLGVY